MPATSRGEAIERAQSWVREAIDAPRPRTAAYEANAFAVQAAAEERWAIWQHTFGVSESERVRLVAEQGIVLAELGLQPDPLLILEGRVRAMALWYQLEARNSLSATFGEPRPRSHLNRYYLVAEKGRLTPRWWRRWLEAELGSDEAFDEVLTALALSWIQPAETPGDWPDGGDLGFAPGYVYLPASTVHSYINATGRVIRGGKASADIARAITTVSGRRARGNSRKSRSPFRVSSIPPRPS